MSYTYTGNGDISLAGKAIAQPKLRFQASRTFLSLIFTGGQMVFGKIATGSGGASVAGSAQIQTINRRYNQSGSVSVRGFIESSIGLNSYSYVASTNAITIAGQIEVTKSYANKKCSNKFVCKIESVGVSSQYTDCFEPQFVYTDCGKNRIRCNPNSGAFLPAVTICRQRFLIPPLLDPTNKKSKTWSTRES
jgi:hypothetical protein